MRKLGFVALLVLALAACGGKARRPDDTKVAAMSLEEAHRVVREATLNMYQLDPRMQFTFSDAGIRTDLNGVTRFYRYSDTPKPILKACGDISNCADQIRVWTRGTGPGAREDCCYWIWWKNNRSVAERFQLAFARLAQGWSETLEEAAQFQKIVAAYHAARPRPELTEDVRRARIGAEAAFADKRFDDAAVRYADALALAPWWPEGRFNRALILGELGRYAEATAEMKKYLALAPNAPNARQAQDQIYKWEEGISIAQ